MEQTETDLQCPFHALRVLLPKKAFKPVSAGFCYVPGGIVHLRDIFFGRLLAEKENGYVMYQQASPFGDKRQFVGIVPSP